MRHILLIPMIAVLSSCQDLLLDSPEPAAILLSSRTVHLAPDEKGSLAYVLQAEDSSLLVPTGEVWTSRDPSIVSVDSTGRLRAHAVGTTRVVIAASGIRDSATVIVRRDWAFVAAPLNGCRVRSDGEVRCGAMTRPGPYATTAIWGTYASYGQCVLASGGVVHCRGTNYAGALGDGSPMDSSFSHIARDAFAPIAGPAGYDQIVGYIGLSYCGRRGGEVRCWGYDTYGAIGNDTSRVNVGVPTVVAGALTFTSLAVEKPDPEICGTAAGRLWCWGSYGATPPTRVPRPITPDVGLVEASVEFYHGCGLDAAGQAWCWGYNNDGELGRGTFGPDWVVDSIPSPVATTLRFTDIYVTFSLTCAVSLEGDLWCWGLGGNGQFGAPGPARSSTPVKIASPQAFISVHSGQGSNGACALTVGGAEYCWGNFTPNLDTRPADYLPRRTPSPY